MPDKFTAMTAELHRYAIEHGARQDEVLRRLAAETERRVGDLAIMQISPDQGAFITLLVKAIGAERALEVGTFTGYGSICIARGLPHGGRLVTCEVSEEYAEIARRYFREAGVEDRIGLRMGPALDTLRMLPQREVFDFVFIDADKSEYLAYWEQVVPRLRRRGLVMVDNVFYGGEVIGDGERTEGVRAIRALNDRIAADERFDVAMLGIADGVTLALKR
jgi:caffeoyl-CoA O-methyltransferase